RLWGSAPYAAKAQRCPQASAGEGCCRPPCPPAAPCRASSQHVAGPHPDRHDRRDRCRRSGARPGLDPGSRRHLAVVGVDRRVGLTGGLVGAGCPVGATRGVGVAVVWVAPGVVAPGVAPVVAAPRPAVPDVAAPAGVPWWDVAALVAEARSFLT